MPDLSGYQPADPARYGKYYDYPATYGVHFLTPGGYRCRITYTAKANPPLKTASCWGALPGTSFDSVFVQAAITLDPARFADIDPDAMETYSHWDQPTRRLKVDPNSYRLLPPGNKLTYTDSGTCAVSATTTTCVIGKHGFVLDLAGSRTF